MKKKGSVFFICFFTLFKFIAQNNPNTHARTYDLFLDVEILRTTLTEKHPVLYNYISKARFDSLCNDLMVFAKTKPGNIQFATKISQLLSQIGCGHTYAILPYSSYKDYMALGHLPFSISVVDEHIYITQVTKPQYAALYGAEIKSINTVPTQVLYKQWLSMISSDGYNKTYKTARLQSNFEDYLKTSFNLSKQFNMETLDTLGKQQFTTVSYDSTIVITEPEEKKIALTYPYINNQTALLSIPDFDGGGNKFKTYFQELEKQRVKNLVIDLRNNGGGNGNMGAKLLSYILDSAFTINLEKKTTPASYPECLGRSRGLILSSQYTKKDSVTRSYYFTTKIKEKNNFNGKVIVLINERTFSTAAYVASALKYKANAVCIGTESGGGEYALCGGTISSLKLPYSEIEINFPVYRWIFNTAHADTGKGIMPDILCKPDLKNGIYNIDLEKEAIVKLINTP